MKATFCNFDFSIVFLEMTYKVQTFFETLAPKKATTW